MITLHEIEEAIEELQEAPRTYTTAQKLATFYILRDYMQSENLAYSRSNAEDHEKRIHVTGDSEFLRAINGADSTAVCAVMDELMETLRIVNPRLYDGVMRRIDAI